MKNHLGIILKLIWIAAIVTVAAACGQQMNFGSDASTGSDTLSSVGQTCTNTAFGTVCNGTPTGTNPNPPPGADVFFYSLTPIPNSAGMAASVGQYAGQHVAGSMSLLTSQSRITNLNAYAPQLNVSDQAWSLGFPGHPNLKEWFGLCYDGTWTAPASGAYTFVTAVDDAVAIWIDGQLIGENDGGTVNSTNQMDLGTPFSPNPVAFPAVNITAGQHQVKIMYYQAWPTELEIQVWALPPGLAYTAGSTPSDSNVLQLSSPVAGSVSCPQ